MNRWSSIRSCGVVEGLVVEGRLRLALALLTGDRSYLLRALREEETLAEVGGWDWEGSLVSR